MLDTFVDPAQLNDGKTFQVGYWTKITVPLNYFRKLMNVMSNDVNRVVIQNAAMGGYYAAMWLGNVRFYCSCHSTDPLLFHDVNNY